MVDLSLNITLANISWRHKKAIIQPYFTGGFGYMGYEPVITTAGVGSVTFPFKNTGANVQSFYIPIGAGFKFNVSRDISLDLGYTAYLVSADNFDGFNYGAGKDKFSYGHFWYRDRPGQQQKATVSYS